MSTSSYTAKRKTADEKKAFALYKKHMTGRGYAWSVDCTIPQDVQAACLEAMRWARLHPQSATNCRSSEG